MARSLLQRSCAIGFIAALVGWSCSSSSPPSPPDAHGGGAGAGGGGAQAGGSGGSSSDVGGVAGNQAAGGQGGTVGGAGSASGGTSATAGTTVVGTGGDAEGGMSGNAEAGAGVGGAGEGGAGGAADAPFEGRCGEAWAASGSTTAPELEGDVTPQVDKSGNYSFGFGRYRLVVAGSRGGRVTEFSLDGNNLIDPNQGSTFWPSPQQAYTWPPPTEIDSDPYAAKADSTSLTLTSDIATSIGLSVRKRFWVNAESAVVSIEYRLTNESKKTAAWAPWEVTRVRAGGYTFAPQGPGNRTITQDSFQRPLPLSLLPDPDAALGIEWLNYPSLTLNQDNYIVEFDGAEGWLAHANRLGKSKLPVLFVKSFVDAVDADLPTNQAEIQLWTSGTATTKLIEVEQQGAEQTLAAGESLTWTVHWSACELPSSLVLAAGSDELAALARSHAVSPE